MNEFFFNGLYLRMATAMPVQIDTFQKRLNWIKGEEVLKGFSRLLGFYSIAADITWVKSIIKIS